MKKLKKKLLVSALCLLPLMTSGCDISINVDKDTNKSENHTADSESANIEDISVNGNEVTELLKNTFFTDNYDYPYTIMAFGINDIYYQNHFDINDMTNYQRNVLVTLLYNYKQYKDSYQCPSNASVECGSVLDVEKYENYTREIFGPSYNYVQPTSTDSDEHSCVVNYDQNLQKYIFYNCGYGGPNTVDRYNKVVKATKNYTNNLITINLKSFYAQYNNYDNDGIYYDIKANGQFVDENNKDLTNSNYDTVRSKYDELFSKYSDKAEEYQFTYKLDGNKYYLFSIDKIK